VVDLPDIQKNHKTNQDYFNELQSELGDEMERLLQYFQITRRNQYGD
jgi:type I restriction enzyme R subunit